MKRYFVVEGGCVVMLDLHPPLNVAGAHEIANALGRELREITRGEYVAKMKEAAR